MLTKKTTIISNKNIKIYLYLKKNFYLINIKLLECIKDGCDTFNS
jgi:hypothetical protein